MKAMGRFNHLSIYDRARGGLKTGDMLLFSGSGIISTLIKLRTRSRWSHIGMVYKIDDEDLVLCIESDKEQDGIIGVQAIELSRKIMKYRGKVFYRPIYPVLSPQEVEKLREFRKKTVGIPYEKDLRELRAAVSGVPLPEGSSRDSLFCSEIFVYALQHIGRMSKQVDPSTFSPNRLARDIKTHYINNSFGDLYALN